MKIKLGINGFGRIGRNVLRALIESGVDDLEVVAINDLAPVALQAHLFQYDSVHGKFNGNVSHGDDWMEIEGKRIQCSSIREPENLPWADVDVALECTGFFTSREAAARHLGNGSKKVVISTASSDADQIIVYGVNHELLSKDDVVISNASCTTNCLAPIAKVLNDAIGIEKGYMTTIHSYTGDQPVLDTNHSDFYRARAAALSAIPTSTGAARAVGLVLPELNGKLDGSAIRIPTPNVSAVDLTFQASRNTTAEEINQLFADAANNPANPALSKVLGTTDLPLVSSDFNHSTYSSIVATDQTQVQCGDFVRVLSWYDNEWGFSNRMLDTARHLANAG